MALSKEKKTLLLSIMVVGIAATMLGAGTLAYFSSTVDVGPNLFTAGTIDLLVNGASPYTGNFNATLSDLKPCMKGWGNVTLSNNGTNPMQVWLKIKNVGTAGGNQTYPESQEPAANDIDGVIRYDLYINGTYPLITDAANYTISAGTHQLSGVTLGVKDYYIYLGPIPYGGTLQVNQSFTMDCNTTNWAQGDEMTFTVEFYAQQSEPVDNPPSPPATELSGYGRSNYPY